MTSTCNVMRGIRRTGLCYSDVLCIYFTYCTLSYLQQRLNVSEASKERWFPYSHCTCVYMAYSYVDGEKFQAQNIYHQSTTIIANTEYKLHSILVMHYCTTAIIYTYIVHTYIYVIHIHMYIMMVVD